MRRRWTAAAICLTLVGAAAGPSAVAAHSELVSSSPSAGTTLATPPTEITGEFSEALDTGRSSMELRGPDGATMARGGVPPGSVPTHMAMVDLPPLAPGAYEVRWTTVTPDDGGVERGTFAFTVATAAPSPAVSAGAEPAVTPAASPAGVEPTVPPSASPAPGEASGSGAGDLLLPFLALAAVVAVGAALLRRRRR